MYNTIVSAWCTYRCVTREITGRYCLAVFLESTFLIAVPKNTSHWASVSLLVLSVGRRCTAPLTAVAARALAPVALLKQNLVMESVSRSSRASKSALKDSGAVTNCPNSVFKARLTCLHFAWHPTWGPGCAFGTRVCIDTKTTTSLIQKTWLRTMTH